ncbi:xanthine dehydrogenase family protein molybdopterin-binding subunit [Candidatus Nephthysia bennettiae]|uniref:Xanthine dehydrogenase family protein molybdopterin-binding subunit n=1 Tax=Candidatus Nephthysia bennettiae TaxID=3127016 RepID=A0A934KCN5_9BACT|nr:xanthine dehydrogenase family protein molybdopterin-binding subunit [Candidatus Dormibacteraeota bacterium]MBJ7614881.1 xanthine dehydrogenase family protein molybdopterin-binding subunit [Candidatus Dormibacteraeota bacterium]
MPPLIGSRLRRLEDPRLITGQGRYSGDIPLSELVHLAVVRSPLPHARVSNVDLEEARALPGVLAAWLAADLPETARLFDDWAPRHVTRRPRPVLASDEVRYVGEGLAVVVAETSYQAADAAQAVFADLEEMPASATVEAALADGAPGAHGEHGGSVAGQTTLGYGDLEAAFAGEGIVTAKARLKAARICGSAMEPRTVTASYEAGSGELTVWTSTQTVFGVRDTIAKLLDLDPDKVAVRAEDVGGGFGPKGTVYPEEVLVAFAAVQLGRPVRWTATRSEDTATTVHAHGTVMELELAAGPDGRLRGLRGMLAHDAGAYTISGAAQPEIIVPHMISAYVLPAIGIDVRVVLTNATPTGFVRGGGRPLGNFAMERLMDRLARELDMDPAELRRRNLIQPGQMPYDTGFPAGRATYVYDGGDYPRLLEMALEGIAGARAGQGSDGRLRGVGLACCVESSGFGRNEPARVRLGRDGEAHLFIGSTPQGQAHVTVAAQVLADRLGWPLDRIRVTAGDTRLVARAELTAGSRTAVQVGNATAKAAAAMRRRVLERAAEVLEADPADLLMEDGVVSVRGVPARSVPVQQLVPEEGLEVSEAFTPSRPLAFSSGCHAAVVDVDPTTGSVDLKQYVIAHDTGRAINELVVEGQIQGGFAHGLGYALFEEAIYTREGGFISASFLDYSIPGAPEVGVPSVVHIETPTDANPEGFKGAGESGTIPAPAAITNAIEDALRQVKPDVLVGEIPVTPNRIFELLQKA